MKESNAYIVFYDGDCGLCNRVVQFVLKHEKQELLQFAALQSDYAKSFFAMYNEDPSDLSTFYYFENGKFTKKSTAALHLSKHLKLPWNLGRMFLIIPRFIRDGVYDFIAKRRHKVSNTSCRLLTTQEKKRFLD